MSVYHKFRGHVVGRVYYFLLHYTKNPDLFLLKRDGTILHFETRQQVGTYSWDKQTTDIPTFNFIEEYHHIMENQALLKDRLVFKDSLRNPIPWEASQDLKNLETQTNMALSATKYEMLMAQHI